MNLYLVQHGQALAEYDDPLRALNDEGRKNAEKIAQFLRSNNIEVEEIWHSRKLRAMQTGQIIYQYIPCRKIVERDDLNPQDPVDKFPGEILEFEKDLIIVGHLPFLQKLASLILTGSSNFNLISFQYSAIACLQYQENWKIAWFVISDII
jgi:phosphohistidine phosphatase